MDAPRKYMEELRSEIGLYPTWMPTNPIALGEFGTFVRGSFRRAGSLQDDLGISFTTTHHDNSNSFNVRRGIRFEAAGRTKADTSLIEGSLSVTVAAESAYSWAFGAIGVRKVEIKDLLQVQSAVLAAVDIGTWKTNWLIVSEVYHVDRLNVIVAKSRNVLGRLAAKGALPSPADILLAQELSYQLASDDVLVVQNAKQTTPLFGLHQVRGMLSGALVPIAGGARHGAMTLQRTVNANLYPSEG